MNGNSLKKLLAVAMTGLFLISVGASAAAPTTKAKCEKAGGTWMNGKCKMPTQPQPQPQGQ